MASSRDDFGDLLEQTLAGLSLPEDPSQTRVDKVMASWDRLFANDNWWEQSAPATIGEGLPADLVGWL